MSGNGGEGIPSRHRTVVTAAIALTSLAIAAAGFLQVRASSRSNAAAQRSAEYAAQTMSSLLQSEETAKVDYETLLRAEQQREQAGNAFQQAVFSNAGDRALLALVQDRFLRMAEKTQALTPLTPDSPDGPNVDPQFPRHHFARSTAAALRFQALQDASNARNSAWEARAASYTAVLTLLAVSLYLFGLSLAMPRKVFTVFASVGVGLFLIGAAWALYVVADSPRAIPDTAAQEYADGEIALETSTIGQDAEGFQSSIDHFSAAIVQWPGFARAYLGRANASLSTAPGLQATLIPIDTLERVISDLDHASALGLRNGLLLEQLSGSKFSLALHGKQHLFAKAAADAREAMVAVPDDPVPRYALAVSLLGKGDTAGAEAAYRDAITHTLYSDDAATTPRGSAQLEQGWVSGALSDLEALRAATPSLGSAIDRMKGLVVGSIAAGAIRDPSGSATFSGVQAQTVPSAVVWATAGSTGYDRGSDLLSAQWYGRTDGGTWVGIPEVSGPVDPTRETAVPSYSARNITGASVPPRCLGQGDYRVELYVNGTMAGSAETTVQYGPPAVALIDRALNLEMCHPPGWKRSKNALPGFRQGLVSPDGTRGVYLIRYDLSLLPASLRNNRTEAITDGLLVATATTSGYLFPAALTRNSAPTHQASLGLAGSSQRSFAYKGGLVFGQAALDPNDGAVYVTFTFGPQTAFVPPSGDLLPLIQSIAEYRPGG